MNFVFWQNMPTHHQAPWLSSLACLSGGRVLVALEDNISQERRSLGWSLPPYAPASVEIGLSPARVNYILQSCDPDTIHVFSGLGSYPGVHNAFRRCMAHGAHLGVMAEGYRSGGFRGWARSLAGRVRIARFGGGIDFLLGIGDAPEHFRRLGLDSRKIFDFAYFPPFPTGDEQRDDSAWTTAAVRFAYIGSLEPRKGLDRLFRQLASVERSNWTLNLVGRGPDEIRLRSLVSQLGLDQRVRFLGAMTNSAAMSVLRSADVLVLPSYFDGWGAVVNEALSQGVPVICSDKCGARHVILGDASLGSVFSSDASLKESLNHWISNGTRTELATKRIQHTARSIAPEAGAKYFLKVVEHVYKNGPRPLPAWAALKCCPTVNGV